MLDDDKKKVVFRRIRGRIVPIRVDRTKKKPRTLEASALIAAGSVISVGSEALAGMTVGKLTKRAASRFQASTQLTRVAKLQDLLGIPVEKNIPSITRAASKTFSATSSLKRAGQIGKGIRGVGLFVGAGLIASGIDRLIDDNDGEKTGLTKDIISNTVSVGVGFIGAKALRKGLVKSLKGSAFKLKNKQLEFEM